MRLAALADIHGNLPALEAVLADARARGAERLVDELPMGDDALRQRGRGARRGLGRGGGDVCVAQSRVDNSP